MHRTYSFLLHPGENASENWPVWAAAEFLSQYAEDYCDSDNSYQEQALVLPDGQFEPLCSSDDDHGRYWIQEKLANTRRKHRWDWAMQLTLINLARDLQLFGPHVPASLGHATKSRIENMSHSELLAAIHTEIPKTLAESYAQVTEPPWSVHEGDFSLVEWLRWNRAGVFEMFRSSYFHAHPPFIEPLPPSSGYRAFELAGSASSENSDNVAILFVDIHT